MLVIGLIGGIASGKSVVAAQFAKLGIDIIDADLIARELTRKGQSAFTAIIEHFGEAILTEEGSINRRALRSIVFQDEAERLWLEDLLHPLIRAEIHLRASQAKSCYCMLVIPLLTTRSAYPIINRVLLVDTPEHLQLTRVQERDQISMLQAKAILLAQSSREQRLALADDIIVNDGEIKDIEAQVLALHQRYLQYANQT